LRDWIRQEKQKRAKKVRIGEIAHDKTRTFTGRVRQAGAGGRKALHSLRLPAVNFENSASASAAAAAVANEERGSGLGRHS